MDGALSPAQLGVCKGDGADQYEVRRVHLQLARIHPSRQGTSMCGKTHEGGLGCWQADAAEDVDGRCLSAAQVGIQQKPWQETCDSCTTHAW